MTTATPAIDAAPAHASSEEAWKAIDAAVLRGDSAEAIKIAAVWGIKDHSYCDQPFCFACGYYQEPCWQRM